MNNQIEFVLNRLAYSRFRSRFHLKEKERQMVIDKGFDVIKSHAEDFIEKRLAMANPNNDGKQTPMRNHPVFIAQHATATCCRGCISKWHKIPTERNLTEKEKEFLVELIMAWINKEMKG